MPLMTFSQGRAINRRRDGLISMPFSAADGIPPDTLALNFLTGTYEVNSTPVTLTDYVTCTRAGVATYVNSSGVVTDASANTLRFDYAPNGGALRGILIETGLTNQMIRTEEFSDASWTKVRLATTADTTTSPAGTMTADRCLCNGTGGGMYIERSSSSFTGATFTASVWIKKGSGDWAVISMYNGANSLNQFYNVSTGAIGSRSNGGNYTFTDATITDYGGGWFRCTLTITRPDTTASSIFSVYLGTTADGVYSCTNGVSEGFIWGAQLEVQGIATSYVRASASAVARASDVVTMTGTDFSDWYNASQGTFVSNFIARTTIGHLLSANDNTANEAIFSRFNAGVNNLVVTDGGGYASRY